MANVPPIKVYWDKPAPIFVARVNLPGTISYPIQDIPFDGVTVGAYTACHADMFFTLGSAQGLDDYGRGRLRAAPTATVLKVGRASQGHEDGELNVVDNAWLHVYPEFRVHSKVATIINAVEYKDSDIPVGDLTAEPPPIANLGADYAATIDPDSETITVFFPGSNSMAVADGATIIGYAWVAPTGSFVSGTSATDDDVFIEFPAGRHVVRLTVTDSNGKTNTGHRLVIADDPDDSLCVSGMQVQNVTRAQQGTTARLRVLQNLPRGDYPDGAKVLVWEDRDPAIYGSPNPASRDHMLFMGWHQTDNASSRALETHLQRETILTCVDVAGRLDSLPGWHQRIEVPDEEEGLTWGEMPAANMDKFLCYLLHWHSTANGVADFYPSGTWDAYPFVLFDSAGATLYEQMQRQANRIVPDHDFMCDRFGALQVVVNPLLQNPADRTATTQNSLTVASWSEIEFSYQRPPRIHTTRGSALLTQTEWIIDDDGDKQLVQPVFCIAPGTAPGQGGREATLGERLAPSQQALNDCIGHHHARSNARYGLITVTLDLNADPWDFNPAAHTWVQLIITAGVAPYRGIDFETTRTLCHEVSIDYVYTEEATQWRGRVVLEVETVGLPALTEEREATLPVGEQPTPITPPLVTTPPDSGLRAGQEQVIGIGPYHFYRTADFQTPSGSGGPTWAKVTFAANTGEEILSWVVDPFSPGYIDGSGAINGWVVTHDTIYRVNDLFGTMTRQAVHTIAVDASGASHWRTIQASFGAYFEAGVNPWLICVSYYGSTGGHTGTWATYSVDGGVTWADEVLVSAFYDSGLSHRQPIGLYCSPKTPGLAYTAAYSETGAPAPAGGYVSTDWGATWTLLSAEEDPDEPLPLLGLIISGTAGTLPFEVLTVGAQASIAGTLTEGAINNESKHWHLMICAPADAKRVVVQGAWTATYTRTGGFTSSGVGLSIERPLSVSVSGDFAYSAPAANTTTSGSFTTEFTYTGGADWPVNRELVEATPPSNANNSVNFHWSLLSTHPVQTVSFTLAITVIEIELDDGTIYTPQPNSAIAPEHSQAGAIHLPWPDNDGENLFYFGATNRATNRRLKLKRLTGDVLEEIGPNDGTRDYGVYHGHFTARTFDSNRAHVLLGGRGNDTSSNISDDLVGVWISHDGGDSWDELVAPVGQATALYGLSAAFGGDSEDVIFIWGGYTDEDNIILYTDDGATLDDRTGNLASLVDGTYGEIAFIGLAGGPLS